MISITKDEAMALRAKYGESVCIAITNRHKKGRRKHYYAEETNRVLFFIERFRGKRIRKTQPKKRGL